MKLAANGTAAVREGHGGRVSVVGRQVAQERVLLTVARDCKVLHRLHIVTHRHEILGLYASLLDHIRCNVLLASKGLAHSLSSCIERTFTRKARHLLRVQLARIRGTSIEAILRRKSRDPLGLHNARLKASRAGNLLHYSNCW